MGLTSASNLLVNLELINPVKPITNKPLVTETFSLALAEGGLRASQYMVRCAELKKGPSATKRIFAKNRELIPKLYSRKFILTK